MSVRNLQHLFRPESVAVIGASNREHSVGSAVMCNLLAGGFKGPVMPVNPKHEAVAGVLAYPDVGSLPLTPDLAVVCTPAATVPGLIAELGARGTRAAVVLTAGLTHAYASDGRTLQQAMLDAAHPHLLRILGPNCLGLLVPGAGLNASFAHLNALPGQLALVHQSGALCTALLDWAQTKGVGFSHFVSIGDGGGARYTAALEALLDDEQVDAVLVLHAPTAVVSNLEVAEAVARVATAREVAPRLLASWLGGAGVQAARARLSEAGIANYDTPEGAVRGFMHRVRYRRNQVLLMETPPAAPDRFEAATDAVRLIIDRALSDGREALTEPEAKAILSAYGIPVVETRIVSSPEAA